MLTLAVLFIIPCNTFASGVFPLEDNPLLIGHTMTHTIRDKETLILIARAHDVGYREITDANRHIDPWVPVKGTRVLIPTSWLIPEVLDKGIVINLAELRLYYFFSVENSRYVSTYPLSVHPASEGCDRHRKRWIQHPCGKL